MKYKLVALDIDGTLLNSNHELLSENIIVVKKLVEQDVRFILVTGRPDIMALEYANQLNIEPIILGYNGATIRNLTTKKIFNVKFIDFPLAQEICSVLNKSEMYYRLYCMDCVYSFNEWEFDEVQNIYSKFSKRLAETMGFKVLHSLEELSEPIVKIVVFSENSEELLRIREELKDFNNISVVFGSKNGLDINAFGVNKGQAILDYAKKLGISSQQIVAIGDSENDLSMLEVVGMPVTLENGSNLLKERVKFITKSNDNAGVAYALKHLFIEKFKDMYKELHFLNREIVLWGEERIVGSLSILAQKIAICKHVYSSEFLDVKSMENNDLIIVSSFNNEPYIKQLLNKDLKYGKDFILIDDFIRIIDNHWYIE